jgi:hypothetical protein
LVVLGQTAYLATLLLPLVVTVAEQTRAETLVVLAVVRVVQLERSVLVEQEPQTRVTLVASVPYAAPSQTAAVVEVRVPLAAMVRVARAVWVVLV